MNIGRGTDHTPAGAVRHTMKHTHMYTNAERERERRPPHRIFRSSALLEPVAGAHDGRLLRPHCDGQLGVFRAHCAVRRRCQRASDTEEGEHNLAPREGLCRALEELRLLIRVPLRIVAAVAVPCASGVLEVVEIEENAVVSILCLARQAAARVSVTRRTHNQRINGRVSSLMKPISRKVMVERSSPSGP